MLLFHKFACFFSFRKTQSDPTKPPKAIPANKDKPITETKAVIKYKILPLIKFFEIS